MVDVYVIKRFMFLLFTRSILLFLVVLLVSAGKEIVLRVSYYWQIYENFVDLPNNSRTKSVKNKYSYIAVNKLSTILS